MSKNTSIKQVPALHKWAIREGYIQSHDRVLDYGCGKYPDAAVYLHDNVPHLFVESWDKYWRDIPEYIASLSSGYYDTVLCANVLNVIKSDDEMEGVVKQIWYGIAEPWQMALFSVYEGDRSGVGGKTKKGYQRNAKARDYMPLLTRYFTYVERHGNMFICLNSQEND